MGRCLLLNKISAVCGYVWVLAVFLGCYSQANGQAVESKLVSEWLSNPSASQLVDYSYAGYGAGALPPKKIDLPKLAVSDYGAKPNDGLDDIAAIQKTVVAAEKQGGAIITFKPGTYDFDVATVNKFVRVRGSNIILRGSGDGLDGTILLDHHASTWPNPDEKWKAGQYPSFFLFEAERQATPKTWPISSAQRGQLYVLLATKAELAIGTTINIAYQDPGDSSLLQAVAGPLASYRISPAQGSLRSAAAEKFCETTTVTRTAGDTVFLAAPILLTSKPGWQPVLRVSPWQQHGCAVEGFRMVSSFGGPFQHHLNAEHDDGWDAILARGLTQSWMRNLAFVKVSTAVTLTDCAHITIYDCRIEGGPGHNGHSMHESTSFCLFADLQAGRQMHAWSFNQQASGNVLYNCYADDPSGVDGHGGTGICNLIDNLHGSVWAPGGSSVNTPPALGRGLTFYNWQPGVTDPYNNHIRRDILRLSPLPGVVIIGLPDAERKGLYLEAASGQHIEKDTTNASFTVEAFGNYALPYSLYQAQRKRRGLAPW